MADNTLSSSGPLLVLVAVADEKYGSAIADFIARHHWPRNTHLYILYVVDEVSIQGMLSFSQDMAQKAIYEDEVYGSKLIERTAARISAILPVHSEQHIVRGSAKEKIIETAKNIKPDLIIVGSHGRTGLASFLLGSVSMYVVAHAHCSVLVVRDPNSHVA